MSASIVEPVRAEEVTVMDCNNIEEPIRAEELQ